MDELIQQLIMEMLASQGGGGQTAIASPRGQVQPEIPPEALLQMAADATRVAPRTAGPQGSPSIRATPDPPLGNIVAQIARGLEGALIEGTPLDPRQMGEEAPLRAPIEGILNRLRGPSGPAPGEGIPGLELASLIGAGAVTPGPGEFRNIVGVMERVVRNPQDAVTLLLDDAPAIERMIQSAPDDLLDEFSGAVGLKSIQNVPAQVKSALRAIFARAEVERLRRIQNIFGEMGDQLTPQQTRSLEEIAGSDLNNIGGMIAERLTDVEQFEALTRFLMSAGGR